MSGAIPPFPNTPSWRGAQLKKHRDNFVLFFLPCRSGRDGKQKHFTPSGNRTPIFIPVHNWVISPYDFTLFLLSIIEVDVTRGVVNAKRNAYRIFVGKYLTVWILRKYWCIIILKCSEMWHCSRLYFIILTQTSHIRWVPVITAWCVLGLWMEVTASRNGG
jgi:hypothetical protein